MTSSSSELSSGRLFRNFQKIASRNSRSFKSLSQGFHAVFLLFLQKQKLLQKYHQEHILKFSGNFPRSLFKCLLRKFQEIPRELAEEFFQENQEIPKKYAGVSPGASTRVSSQRYFQQFMYQIFFTCWLFQEFLRQHVQ